MQRENRGDSVDDVIPRGLRIGAAFTWRLLIIATAVVGVALVARSLSEIVIPFLIGIILAALLVPLANFLQRLHFPKWLAILVAMVLGFAVVVGLLLLVTDRVLTTLPQLEKQARALGKSLNALLATHPFGITPAQINRDLSEVMQWLHRNASSVASRAASAGNHLVHMLEGIFIIIFVTLFSMIDGAVVWAWITRLFPRRARARIDAAGQAGWHTLTEFSRVQILVAAIDAVAIGVGAWLLGVPLAMPIGVVVFFGALVPIIGSIVAGTAAVIIALLFNGWTHAWIMLGIVLLVNQIEGNVLHPLITGNTVRVHPLGIVLGVTAGAVIAGIAGAFFAVPLIATANAMINAAAHYHPNDTVRAVHGSDAGYARQLANAVVPAQSPAHSTQHQVHTAMSETTVLHGHIRKLDDGSFQGKLQRVYAGHDRAAVWHMLTDATSLTQWIAPGTIEPRKGGKAHIDFQDSGIIIDSEVLEFDAPRALAYSWSNGNQPLRPLRWELEAVDDGTRLALTITTPAGEDPAKACAGFEGHLEMLAAALEGVPIKFPFDLFLAARKAYNQQVEK